MEANNTAITTLKTWLSKIRIPPFDIRGGGFHKVRMVNIAMFLVLYVVFAFFGSNVREYYTVEDMRGAYHRTYSCDPVEIVETLKMYGNSVLFIEDCPFSFKTKNRELFGFNIGSVSPFVKARYHVYKTKFDSTGYMTSKEISDSEFIYYVGNGTEHSNPADFYRAKIDVGPFLVSSSIFLKNKAFTFTTLPKRQVTYDEKTPFKIASSNVFAGVPNTTVIERQHFLNSAIDHNAQAFLAYDRSRIVGVEFSQMNVGGNMLGDYHYSVFGFFALDEETGRPYMMPWTGSASSSFKAEERFFRSLAKRTHFTDSGFMAVGHDGHATLVAGLVPGLAAPSHDLVITLQHRWRLLPLVAIVGAMFAGYVYLTYTTYQERKERFVTKINPDGRGSFLYKNRALLLVSVDVLFAALAITWGFHACRNTVGGFWSGIMYLVYVALMALIVPVPSFPNWVPVADESKEKLLEEEEEEGPVPPPQDEGVVTNLVNTMFY